MIDLNPEKKSVPVTFLITPSTHERAIRLMQRTALNMSEMARQGLNIFLDEADKKLAESATTEAEREAEATTNG